MTTATPFGTPAAPSRLSFAKEVRIWIVRALAPAAAAALVGAGCGGPPPGGFAAMAEIASPAGPGSGQPHLERAGESGVWMSWTEPAAGGGHRVLAALFDGGGAGEWGVPVEIARGGDFFVNWADFPSVRLFGDRLVAHWLQRGGRAKYDYDVRVAWSEDGGATWSPPWTPHEDGTPTEHGFVSFFAHEGAPWAVWLDGRAMVDEGGAMTLRSRRLPEAASGAAVGAPGPDMVVDSRTCECCQTDAAVADGVPVVVYRDRTGAEVRDIHVSRLTESGWTPSRAVHDDGWVFGGCPVNGPAMAARGADVAVAWFAAPDGEPRVQAAFSVDGAVSFGDPVRIDAGLPSGRVDAVMLDDGSAIVSWLGQGTGAVSVLTRRARPDGSVGEPVAVVETDAARASGFPRMARLGSDRLMLAWTDPSGDGRVRVSVFDLETWESR